MDGLGPELADGSMIAVVVTESKSSSFLLISFINPSEPARVPGRVQFQVSAEPSRADNATCAFIN
jgi:hypothetical protein